MFHNISAKQLHEARNKIFLERGVPPLLSKGYKSSPFTASWYGRNNVQDYTYDLCRLNGVHLEYITASIASGDSFIKIFLNVFELAPTPHSLDDLKQSSGLKFQLPPCSNTRMRLRMDESSTIPLFRFTEHKLKRFFSNKSFERRVQELGKLIESDLNNIDIFIEKWFEKHVPFKTDWDGNVLPVRRRL